MTALAGCGVLGIEQQRDCFVGRGVLVDVARHQRVEACPPRQVITPQMLDEALAAQGSELRSGDMLLVRTGHLARWWTRPADQTPMNYFVNSPGISRDAAPWLHEHGISALAADTIGGPAADSGGLRRARLSAARGQSGGPGPDTRRAVGAR